MPGGTRGDVGSNREDAGCGGAVGRMQMRTGEGSGVVRGAPENEPRTGQAAGRGGTTKGHMSGGIFPIPACGRQSWLTVLETSGNTWANRGKASPSQTQGAVSPHSLQLLHCPCASWAAGWGTGCHVCVFASRSCTCDCDNADQHVCTGASAHVHSSVLTGKRSGLVAAPQHFVGGLRVPLALSPQHWGITPPALPRTLFGLSR